MNDTWLQNEENWIGEEVNLKLISGNISRTCRQVVPEYLILQNTFL